MPILPITVPSSEIYCCGADHEAVIGEVWRCPVEFEAVWWQAAEVHTPGWSLVERGLVRAQGRLRMASEHALHPLLDLGACTVGFTKTTLANAVKAEGVMLGSWHVPFALSSEDNGYSQITVEGTVRRIRGYEQIRIPDPDDPGFRGYPTGRFELVDGDSMWMGSKVIIDVDVLPSG
jgi:hypothetical protein